MIDYIINTTEQYFKLPAGTIQLKEQRREVVQARQIAQAMAKKHIKGLSNTKIGQDIGNVDNATVLHSIKVVKNLMDTYHQLKTDIETIEGKIIEEKLRRYPLVPSISKMMNPTNYIDRNDTETIDPSTVRIVSHFGWERSPFILLLTAKSNTNNEILFKTISNIREFQHVNTWSSYEAKNYEFRRLCTRLKGANPKLTTVEFRFKVAEPQQLELFE